MQAQFIDQSELVLIQPSGEAGIIQDVLGSAVRLVGEGYCQSECVQVRGSDAAGLAQKRTALIKWVTLDPVRR